MNEIQKTNLKERIERRLDSLVERIKTKPKGQSKYKLYKRAEALYHQLLILEKTNE